MPRFVTPKVFLVGYTTVDTEGMEAYLKESGNEDFLKSIEAARRKGLSDGEILVSFYAKICYASLTLGKNDNITRIRDVPDNLVSTLSSGHGSVWEHCSINFIARDVSRILTHELTRHRAGTAFSQTSGRYVRGDDLAFVHDPILDGVKHVIEETLTEIEEKYRLMVELMKLDEMTDFNRKKKMTSALRRILPNGQSNEIGFTVNLRALRHTVQVRTSRHAEWEIRELFSQVYRLVKDRFPMVFSDAREEVVDGVVEVSGMKMHPYA